MLENMIKPLKYLYISLLLIGAGLQAQTYRPVVLKSAAGTVEANIMVIQGKPKVKPARVYHWYHRDSMYQTTGGYDEKLMHGPYVRFWPDGQLREKGQFDEGLKQGTWKQWHPNGQLAETIDWHKGKPSSKLKIYDLNGTFQQKVKVDVQGRPMPKKALPASKKATPKPKVVMPKKEKTKTPKTEPKEKAKASKSEKPKKDKTDK
jgi:hypothetical protein